MPCLVALSLLPCNRRQAALIGPLRSPPPKFIIAKITRRSPGKASGVPASPGRADNLDGARTFCPHLSCLRMGMVASHRWYRPGRLLQTLAGGCQSRGSGRGRIIIPTPASVLAGGILWHSTERRSPRPSPWTLQCGVGALPKTAADVRQMQSAPRPEDCGEDAYAMEENELQAVLAVADGVGGWRKQGIDPSGFSRGLMRHLAAIVRGERERPAGILSGRLAVLFGTGSAGPGSDGAEVSAGLDPVPACTLLRRAFWRMLRSYFSKAEQPFGSSTACVVSLDRATGVLDTCNLGDSGFLIVRGGRVAGRSISQQFRFNAPYQLTLTPQGEMNDCTAAAANASFDLQSGDVVIVATDGLWDNLFEDDIVAFVQHAVDGAPGSIARSLVERARIAAERSDYESPFFLEAKRQGVKQRPGGKLDDITVVVGLVQSAP